MSGNMEEPSTTRHVHAHGVAYDFAGVTIIQWSDMFSDTNLQKAAAQIPPNPIMGHTRSVTGSDHRKAQFGTSWWFVQSVPFLQCTR